MKGSHASIFGLQHVFKQQARGTYIHTLSAPSAPSLTRGAVVTRDVTNKKNE